MLPGCSCSHRPSRDFTHQSLHLYLSSSSKLPSLPPPTKARALLGFNKLHHQHSIEKGQNFLCDSSSITNPLHLQKQYPYRGSGFALEFNFELYCLSKTLTLPTKNSSGNRRKKRYGGVLPAILRSLDTDSDLEKTLYLFCENLSPKEQTVVLNEQKSWERVVRVFEFFKSQKGYVFNVIHYNVVLRALGRAEKWDELRLCWIEMAKNGVLPTNNTYGMLVDVYGKAGLVKEALFWIKHMRIRGIFPDEVTMNTVVKVLKDAAEYDRADRFYKDWCVGRIMLDDLGLDSMDDIKEGSNSSPVSLKHFLSTELFKTGVKGPTPGLGCSYSDEEGQVKKPRLTSTYNTLIDLYGKANRVKDAADVFGEMLKAGVAMDTITFNTMIFTCGSHGHLTEAESLLKKMEERGISPDIKTYNILLSLYANAGNIEAASICYRKIREVGLCPDIVTYRSFLHVLCEKKMVKEVELVIEEIEKSSLCIDEHSIPGIIEMYVDEGLLDRAAKLLDKCQCNGGFSLKIRSAIMDAYAEKGLWTEAETLFYGKKDLVGQKDILEYNVMVKAYGKAKLYDKAFRLFKGMRNHGTWPDACTYNSLIQMYSGGDLVDKARELLSEMQIAGFKPQCLTFSSVIASYVRLGQLLDAVDVFQEMVRVGVKPNEVVFGSLINGFAESGQVEEALEYLRMMEQCGISVNQVVLTSLIKVYTRLGSFDGAKELYQKMSNLEGGPDVIASNSMIGFYADLGMVSEAESVFNSLREKGCADGVSFATMIYLYKNMGMLDEAIEVAEEMKLSGLLNDSISYNKVMSCYVTNGQLRECGELLHEMVGKELFLDGGTFKILFTLLKKGGVPTEAIMQLESCYQDAKPGVKEAVLTTAFSVVGMHDLALHFCETLMKSELPLDSFAYNVAIYSHGMSGDIAKSLNVFMKLQDEGLDPDLVTYIYLVDCYGKAGMVEGVKRIYSKLKRGEIQQSESLLKAVIDAYKVSKRVDLVELVNQDIRFGFDSEQCSDSETEDEDACILQEESESSKSMYSVV